MINELELRHFKLTGELNEAMYKFTKGEANFDEVMRLLAELKELDNLLDNYYYANKQGNNIDINYNLN